MRPNIVYVAPECIPTIRNHKGYISRIYYSESDDKAARREHGYEVGAIGHKRYVVLRPADVARMACVGPYPKIVRELDEAQL